MRIFISIGVSKSAKEELEKIQNYGKELVRGIKWTSPDKMHVTLEFIGDIGSSKLNILEDLLHHELPNRNAFLVSLGNVNVFPNIYKPNVLVQEIVDVNGEAKRLRDFIHEKIVLHGISSDFKMWRPHVTLGRVKEDNRIDLGLLNANIRNVEWMVDGVDLVDSKLTQKGSLYTIIKSYTLKHE